LRDRLARIAAAQLNVSPEEIIFAGGRIAARSNPDNAISFSRIAATGHWAPGTIPVEIDQTIRETVFWSPPELTAPTEADEVNSSLCHSFIFDFCGVEIDPMSGAVQLDRYVTMHDCGRILHPAMVAGQITGGFAQALGAALYEEYAYAPDGSFLSGTFADYLVPTAMEVPDPIILHRESPSPFTPLGAKGVGEGNSMSTPVCIANAVADALGLAQLDLPATPAKLAVHIHGPEPERADRPAPASRPVAGERLLFGEGCAHVSAAPQTVWRMLLDPATLEAVVPGAHGIQKISDTHFRAEVTFGIGPVRGKYRADVELSDLDPPRALTLKGSAEGALGLGRGTGWVRLEPDGDGTLLTYRYEAAIGGKVASVGGRLLDGAAKVVISQFFAALAAQAGGETRFGILSRLLRRFRRRR
jgi:2-furoyl-CoA dehydrogenase large subunit